jgi:hypothetical protein
LEAWIELVIVRHLTGQDDEEIQQQPAGSSTTVVVRSDTEEEKKIAPSARSSSGRFGPQDGISFLQNLTQFTFLKREAGRFARTLLKILLKHLSPNGRGNVTPDLVLIILKLAVVGQGSVHHDLFLAALDWLLKYQPTES